MGELRFRDLLRSMFGHHEDAETLGRELHDLEARVTALEAARDMADAIKAPGVPVTVVDTVEDLGAAINPTPAGADANHPIARL